MFRMIHQSILRTEEAKSVVTGVAEKERTGDWVFESQPQTKYMRARWLGFTVTAPPHKMQQTTLDYFASPALTLLLENLDLDRLGKPATAQFESNVIFNRVALVLEFQVARWNIRGDAGPYCCELAWQDLERMAAPAAELSAEQIEVTESDTTDEDVRVAPFCPRLAQACNGPLDVRIKSHRSIDQYVVQARVFVQVQRQVVSVLVTLL